MNFFLLKTAFLKTIPVLTGYVFLGIGFGILLQKSGYGVVTALAMSVFIYAGSMQYVAVGLLTSGASLLTTALTTLMVNARHLFYGISMLDKYKGTGKLKPLLIFWLTDETFSINCSAEIPQGVSKTAFYMWVSGLDYLYWVGGSVLGAAVGSLITFNTAGLDFALTALFTVIFVSQWKE